MKNQLRFIVLVISITILLVFIIFVINQTVIIVSHAKSVHPVFGAFVLYGLLMIYAVVFIVPIIVFYKNPSALHPPANKNSAEYAPYIERLKKRLSNNNYLVNAGIKPDDQSYIENAFTVLDSRANELIKSTTSKVFVITAISQNGHLDPVMVFVNQIRMIRNIAQIYNQKPSLREIVQLYMHVASVAFTDSSIEDIDIEEQIEPIIGSVVGYSVVGGLPGTGGLTTFMTKSIIDGSVNALLTLRVGIITRRFYTFNKRENKLEENRLACSEAGKILKDVVLDSTGTVTKHAARAVVKASKRHVSIFGETVKDSAKKSTRKVTDISKKSAEAVGDASIKKAKAILDTFKKKRNKNNSKSH